MAIFTATALIGAAVAGGFAAATGLTIFGAAFTGWAAFGIAAGASLAISAATTLLAPKPKGADYNPLASTAPTQNVRQSITPHRLIYGEVRVGGPYTYINTTGSNEYVHVVIPVAAHECESIGTIYFNDDALHPEMFTANVVNTGTYNGKARVKKNLGAASQVADPDLLADNTELTSDFRGRGRAYIYTRFKPEQAAYPNGMPSVSGQVKGRKLYDPRDGATRWSQNAALAWRDYVADPIYGLGASSSKIDDEHVIAAANACDEFVVVKDLPMVATAVDITNNFVSFGNDDLLLFECGDRVQVTSTGSVPGGLATLTDYYVVPAHYKDDPAVRFATSYANAQAGTTIDLTNVGSGTITVTKKAEPRFTCNGTVDVSVKPVDILQGLMTAMGGRMVYGGGRWRPYAAVWAAPSVIYNEDNLRGSVTTQTRHSRRERFNAVRGLYVAMLNNGQPSNYPAVTNSVYQDQDGGERVFTQLDLNYTNRPQTAQRLAKIELERHRRQISCDIATDMSGMLVQAGDNLALTFENNGWDEKAFEVVTWQMLMGSGSTGPALNFNMSLREIDANAFQFDETTEEVVPNPAPATNLPNPFSVAAPTNLALTSGTAVLDVRLDGSIFSRILVTWTDSIDGFADHYELQHKKSSAMTWSPAVNIPSNLEQAYILDVEDGVSYDVQLRTVSQTNRRSDWVQAFPHTVLGKSAPPSNVPSLTAQQTGNSGVTLRWTAVPDRDVKTYEIRYMSFPFNWNSATPIESGGLSQASRATTFSLPVGTWVVGIKALDTSGNYSATEATATIEVTSTDNTTIFSPEQAPDWLGTMVDLVLHQVSGRLIPKSQDADSTADDVMETFIPRPVAFGYYDPPVAIDLGSDKTGVRVYSELTTGMPPDEPGMVSAMTQYDSRLDADPYDGFEDLPSTATVEAQHIKFRAILYTADGVGYISGFTPLGDAQSHREEETGVTVMIGGYPVVFEQPFFNIPNIQITPTGATTRVPVITAGPTTTGFTFALHNLSDVDSGGTANWAAEGP